MARIYIVEDDWLILAGISSVVLEAGHDVCGAAMEAVAAIRRGLELRPDLALVDGRLARGTSGLDVISALHAAGIPSVLISAHASADEAGAAGAVAFVQKPFHPQILTSVIERSLQQARQIGGPMTSHRPH